MHKRLLTTATVILLAGAAHAEVNLNVDIGTAAPVVEAPAYVAPAPVIVGGPPIIVNEPHHRFRHDDSWYWQERRDRERWEHDHPRGHWDHDHWMHEHHH